MYKGILYSVLISALLYSADISAFSKDNKVQLKNNEYNSSELCAECHQDIYNKWNDSVHALAVKDPIFYTSYIEAYTMSGGEAKILCLKCHAPTVLVTKDYELKDKI